MDPIIIPVDSQSSPLQPHPSTLSQKHRKRLAKQARRMRAQTWTLSELYHRHVWPNSLKPQGRAKRTRECHLESLAKFERICGHPTLAEIDQELVSWFVNRLQQEPTRWGTPPSEATIIKHCVQLQMILDHAGQGNLRRRIVGARLLKTSKIPYFSRPKLKRRGPQLICTLEQIAALLEQARALEGPSIASIAPGEWWSRHILFAYNTGLRRSTLLAAQPHWLDAAGWLHVPGWAVKTGVPDKFWVNEAARRAIEPLLALKQEQIFPWPWTVNWYHACCRRLMRAAGLPPDRSRARGLHRLRRTLITWLAEQNDTVARIVAGHRGGVTREHYVDYQAVIPYLRRLPQPGPAVRSRLLVPPVHLGGRGQRG